MLQVQFDIKRMKVLQDILARLREGEIIQSIQNDYDMYFADVPRIQQLLMLHELMSKDSTIVQAEVERFLQMFDCDHNITDIRESLQDYDRTHPARIFIEENNACQQLLAKIRNLLTLFVRQEEINPAEVTNIQEVMFRLGEFHKHYHRKEKLLFPIFERYGQHTPTRLMWRLDDRVKALYQGAKRQIDQLPHIEFSHVQKTYDTFEKEFLEMIFQEEQLILPVLIETFSEADWQAVADESDAFGYALLGEVDQWKGTKDVTENQSFENEPCSEMKAKDLPFGGGYLTIEEANLILNNLPLEITFVDKNSIFKYFNTITEASDMMLVRTPTSIGRNVANCHPPISLKKVMTLVRDLKTKKRASESMWIKKQGKYVHITYKGLFNEADEFVGILEYVQNIQPFFDLPTEVKTALSTIKDT